VKRFVQGLLCGIALFSLLVLTGIPGLMPGALERMDRAGIAAWKEARHAFARDLAAAGCTGQDAVRAAATARGWEVETVIVGTTRLPQRLSSARYALRVHTVPGLPFDKAPGDLEGFDAEGCLIR